MKTIDPSRPVLVTGAAGYLASWIVYQLLEEGFTVHGTVRSLDKPENFRHLLSIQHRTRGRLKLFEADLLADGAFDEAIKGCELVIHTASPFRISGIADPEQELIQPALIGVRNLFFAAGESGSVKRIVLTSSIVAMVGDSSEISQLPAGCVDEHCWNHSSDFDHQPYPFAKTIAEQEAWRLVEKQSDFDLVVINPGFILGPSLTNRSDSTSIQLMIQLFSGKFKTGVPSGAQAVVDVRDVARAHVVAGFTPEARGRNLTAAHLKDFLDIANVISQQFPNTALPSGYLPKWLFVLTGPFIGYPRRYIKRNVGYDFRFDNSFVRKNLKIDFRPFEQTITDQFLQLVNDRLIPDKR